MQVHCGQDRSDTIAVYDFPCPRRARLHSNAHLHQCTDLTNRLRSAKSRHVFRAQRFRCCTAKLPVWGSGSAKAMALKQMRGLVVRGLLHRTNKCSTFEPITARAIEQQVFFRPLVKFCLCMHADLLAWRSGVTQDVPAWINRQSCKSYTVIPLCMCTHPLVLLSRGSRREVPSGCLQVKLTTQPVQQVLHPSYTSRQASGYVCRQLIRYTCKTQDRHPLCSYEPQMI